MKYLVITIQIIDDLSNGNHMDVQGQDISVSLCMDIKEKACITG